MISRSIRFSPLLTAAADGARQASELIEASVAARRERAAAV